MIIPGLVSATLRALPAEQVIQIAVDNNLKAIEWSENWHIPQGDVNRASILAKMTRAAGLQVAALGSYFRLGKEMDFKPSLEVAHSMDAPVVRIWGGDRPSSELSKQDRDSLAKEAEEVACIAAELGMQVALEWHKNTVTDTNESALNFLTDTDHANLRTLWQPTMALSYQERLEGLKMVREKVVNFHVYYWDQTGRRPLSEGESHWKAYFNVVDKARDCFALLEFVKDDRIEQFSEDAGVLHSLLSGIS